MAAKSVSSSAGVGGSGDAGESMMVSGGRVSNSTSDDAGGGDVVCHSTSRPLRFYNVDKFISVRLVWPNRGRDPET